MTAFRLRNRIILSWGLGVDSTAILLRWLTDPNSRDFDLVDLIVVVAMTGDEFPDLAPMIEEHVLPLMRQHGVRLVQLARGGHSVHDGVDVLSDSRCPDKLYLDGTYKLSTEFLSNGTHQPLGGQRKCSQKQKGDVIDRFLVSELYGLTLREMNKLIKHGRLVEQRWVHTIGFECEEGNRVKKDQDYGKLPGRSPSYPLFDWNWNRQACIDFIESVTGIIWSKSACFMCPFSQGKEEVRRRFRQFPELAAKAALIELNSLTFNSRMFLFGKDATKSVVSVLRDDGNIGALRRYEQTVSNLDWAIWRVRRVWKAANVRDDSGTITGIDESKAGAASRSTKIEATGSRDDMHALLTTKGATTTDQVHGLRRVAVRSKRDDGVFPAVEEFLVVGPVIAREKQRASFEGLWADTIATQPVQAGNARLPVVQ